jgi:hypothetical protein
MSNLAVGWQNLLTVAQRTSWENYATQVTIPDALGNPMYLTGLNWYVKVNTPRLQAGKTRLDTASAIGTLGVLTPIVLSATAPATLSIAFTNADFWATAVGGHLFVYASRPQAPTTNGFKGPYRFAGAVNGAVVPPTSPAVLTAPFVFTLGSRIFIRAQSSDSLSKVSPDFRTFDDA